MVRFAPFVCKQTMEALLSSHSLMNTMRLVTGHSTSLMIATSRHSKGRSPNAKPERLRRLVSNKQVDRSIFKPRLQAFQLSGADSATTLFACPSLLFLTE